MCARKEFMKADRLSVDPHKEQVTKFRENHCLLLKFQHFLTKQRKIKLLARADAHVLFAFTFWAYKSTYMQ
jgi:hypothetical protein